MKKFFALLVSVSLTTPAMAWYTPPPMMMPPPHAVVPPPPPPPKPPAPAPRYHHNQNAGYIAIGCGAGAVAGLMVGSAWMHNKQKRQLTITEAWTAAGIGCPFLLPFTAFALWLCPDNAQTYRIAREAYLAQRRDPQASMQPFTDRYYAACRSRGNVVQVRG